MPDAEVSRIDIRRKTYTSYSVACAGVWTVILLAGQRRLDARERKMLQLVAAGWWSGWTSATIARAVYPPAKPLAPPAERRREVASLILMALGLASVIRLLVRGTRAP